MPGQESGRRLPATLDQTALAPTILDIAGLPRPDRMRGQSLIPRLTSNQSRKGEDLAFTQYLEIDSIFKPLNAGTIGVIDGRHQYILNLASGKGRLRSLDEAHLWDRDHSAENPALAEELCNTICSRFPGLAERRV
jgi:hypothetical protein